MNDSYDAYRCVCALTHDLGYPLKKIEKINKNIKKILPYFSVNKYEDFSFSYDTTQQFFIEYFLKFILTNTFINIAVKDGSDELDRICDNLFQVIPGMPFIKINADYHLHRKKCRF